MPGYAATSNKVVQQSKPITSAKRVDNKDISKFKNKELKKLKLKYRKKKSNYILMNISDLR